MSTANPNRLKGTTKEANGIAKNKKDTKYRFAKSQIIYKQHTSLRFPYNGSGSGKEESL